MTSVALGTDISPVEVTNVSQHGFWVLLDTEELFLPFAEFPWFRNVAIGKILHVELLSPNHLYWPELDVDLAVESIRHPERFPLVSQSSPSPMPRRCRVPKPSRSRSPTGSWPANIPYAYGANTAG